MGDIAHRVLNSAANLSKTFPRKIDNKRNERSHENEDQC